MMKWRVAVVAGDVRHSSLMSCFAQEAQPNNRQIMNRLVKWAAELSVVEETSILGAYCDGREGGGHRALKQHGSIPVFA